MTTLLEDSTLNLLAQYAERAQQAESFSAQLVDQKLDAGNMEFIGHMIVKHIDRRNAMMVKHLTQLLTGIKALLELSLPSPDTRLVQAATDILKAISLYEAANPDLQEHGAA